MTSPTRLNKPDGSLILGMRLIIILIFCAIPIFSIGQRIVKGKVIDESSLGGLPQVKMLNEDSLLLGKTDLDGNFEIRVQSETKQLLLRFVGMEETLVTISRDCNKLEIIMMVDANYDFMTVRRIDRDRYKRFKNLKNLHRIAYEKGIFSSSDACVTYVFKKSLSGVE